MERIRLQVLLLSALAFGYVGALGAVQMVGVLASAAGHLVEKLV